MHRIIPETVQIIKQQINVACEGVACRVSELQTETGVKDRTAQYWIDCALQRASELTRQRVHEPATKDPRLSGKLKVDERKKIKEVISSEISAEVRRWVIEQPPEQYCQLPQDSCKSHAHLTLGISMGINLATAICNEFRPGDHYNVLFGFPGAFGFINNSTIYSTGIYSGLYRIGSPPGFFY